MKKSKILSILLIICMAFTLLQISPLAVFADTVLFTANDLPASITYAQAVARGHIKITEQTSGYLTFLNSDGTHTLYVYDLQDASIDSYNTNTNYGSSQYARVGGDPTSTYPGIGRLLVRFPNLANNSVMFGINTINSAEYWMYCSGMNDMAPTVTAYRSTAYDWDESYVKWNNFSTTGLVADTNSSKNIVVYGQGNGERRYYSFNVTETMNIWRTSSLYTPSKGLVFRGSEGLGGGDWAVGFDTKEYAAANNGAHAPYLMINYSTAEVTYTAAQLPSYLSYNLAISRGHVAIIEQSSAYVKFLNADGSYTLYTTDVKDAEINSYNANTNYGSDYGATVGGDPNLTNGGISRLLVAFPTLASQAEWHSSYTVVNSAAYVMYCYGMNDFGPTVRAYRSSQNTIWNENQVTWNNFSTTGLVADTNSGTSIRVYGQGNGERRYYSFDITETVNIWKTNSSYSPAKGLVFRGTEGLGAGDSMVSFRTKETSYDVPYLMVNYSIDEADILGADWENYVEQLLPTTSTLRTYGEHAWITADNGQTLANPYYIYKIHTSLGSSSTFTKSALEQLLKTSYASVTGEQISINILSGYTAAYAAYTQQGDGQSTTNDYVLRITRGSEQCDVAVEIVVHKNLALG